jgi:hypothetical protein
MNNKLKNLWKRVLKVSATPKKVPIPKALDAEQSAYIEEILDTISMVGYGSLTHVPPRTVGNKEMAVANKSGSQRMDH